MKKHTYNDIEPELVVDEGTAADVILSFAQEREADLIVMGTHGLRGFDRLMLGSVTDRVMRSASCPVLAVREPPHDLVARRSREAQPPPPEPNSCLHRFLRGFRPGFELCIFCNGGIRRRAYSAPRIGKGPKSGQKPTRQ